MKWPTNTLKKEDPIYLTMNNEELTIDNEPIASKKNYPLSIVSYQLNFIFAPTFDQPLAKTVNVARIQNHN